MAAIKRQVPFLIGGTITGIIMTYFWGFPITLLVNSILWYLISLELYGGTKTPKEALNDAAEKSAKVLGW